MRNTLNVQEALRRAGIKFFQGAEFGTFLVPTVQIADLSTLVGEPLEPRAIAGFDNTPPAGNRNMWQLGAGSRPAIVEFFAFREAGSAISAGDFTMNNQPNLPALATAVPKVEVGDSGNPTERVVTRVDTVVASIANSTALFGGGQDTGVGASGVLPLRVFVPPGNSLRFLQVTAANQAQAVILWRELQPEGPP